MANRIPLVVDIDDNNKIKELPITDSLDLGGSGIVNAASIQATGAITAQSLTVNGESLSAVATSGSYQDLTNTPVAFSGDYNNLINKPAIPIRTTELTDVQVATPNNNDVLKWNTVNAQWEPSEIGETFDISTKNIQDLQNVIVTGDVTNKFLKYYSGAWRPSNVTWTDVQSKPTALSQLINDVGFISAETDSQTLSFTNGTLTISGGNSVDISTMDLTGSVFADDSSVMVDAVNNSIHAGEIRSAVFGSDTPQLNIYSDFFTITGGTALDIDAPALTLGSIAPLSTTTVQGDNIILDGGLTSTGTGFYLTHTGESGIQFGSTLEINSNGMGGIVFCGGGTNVDRFDFASAESIKLPTYTDTTVRDAAIIEAYADGGQMVYLADTGPSGSPSGVAGVQIYDGTAGQWRTLSWT